MNGRIQKKKISVLKKKMWEKCTCVYLKWEPTKRDRSAATRILSWFLEKTETKMFISQLSIDDPKLFFLVDYTMKEHEAKLFEQKIPT